MTVNIYDASGNLASGANVVMSGYDTTGVRMTGSASQTSSASGSVKFTYQYHAGPPYFNASFQATKGAQSGTSGSGISGANVATSVMMKGPVTSTGTPPSPSTGTATNGAPPPGLVLLAPKGGETWAAGSTQQIKWSGGSPAWPMTLEIVNGTGSQVLVDLTESAKNTGSYSYTVAMPAGQYIMYLQGDRGKADTAWTYGKAFTVK